MKDLENTGKRNRKKPINEEMQINTIKRKLHA
jgi:hypothetical protein